MTTSSDSDIQYFAKSGPATDVARYGDVISRLPSDPAELGQVVRGLLIHSWNAAMNGIASPPERDGMKTFGAAPTISRVLSLDPAPLDQERPEDERLIGFCYHFALLHCAFLRAKDVPARARCGFGRYFEDGKWIDHWVVEYWDGERWRLNDPQIGLDELSHDDFHDGVRAWQLSRAGDTVAADHGNGELWGWDELRGSLVNDLGALNKLEVGSWDWCEALQVDPLDQPHPTIDAHLDELAELAQPGAPLAQLHVEFETNSTIRPPTNLVEHSTGF